MGNKLTKLLINRELPIVIILSIAAVFVSKMTLLNMPAYWDEMGIYVEPLKRLYDDFTYIAYLRGFYDHPPGLHLLAFPLYKISGASIWAVRCFTLLMSSLTLVMTYLIGLKMGNRVYAATVAIALFTLPSFFAQSVLFLGDNTATGIMLLYFYLAISSSWRWAIAIGVLAGLSRETSLAYGVGVFIFFVIQRKVTWRNTAIAMAPFVALGSFLIAQKFFCGELLSHQVFSAGHITFNGYFSRLGEVIYSRLMGDYFFYFWILFVIGLVISFLSKSHGKGFDYNIRSYMGAIIGIVLTFIVVLSFDMGCLARYLAPTFPLVILMCFYPLSLFLKKSLVGIIFLLLLVFYPHYYGSDLTLGDGHIDDMQYVDVIEVYKKASDYLEENYAGSKIFAPWPLNHVFQSPYMGYVSSAFEVNCQQPFKNKYVNTKRFDLFIWASSSDFEVIQSKEDFVERMKLQLIKRFVHSEKIVEIYGK